MRLSVLLVVAHLVSGALFSQTVPDFTGLKKKENKEEYGEIETNYYDQRDSLVYQVIYDKNGKIIDGLGGLAVIKHTYDKNGDRIETRYFNKDMKLVQNEGGPAIIKQKFDNTHHCIEIGFYNENNKLVKSNFSIIQYGYDKLGRVIEEISLNENRLMTGEIPIKRFRRDQKGRVIEEARYDKNNQLIKTGGGIPYSIVRTDYDEKGRIVRQMFYTEQTKLIDGKAILKINYDVPPPKPSMLDEFDKDPKWMERVYYDRNWKEVDREMEYIPRDARK